jgi:hypothetical protein
MSEAQDLNDASLPDPTGSDPADTEIEELLRSLVPRRPAIDRDRLFFDAGRAAGGHAGAPRRLVRFVWPAVAATLLVACGGLAVELGRKSTALDAALAAVAPKPAAAIASSGAQAGPGTNETERKGRAAANLPTAIANVDRLDSLPPSRRIEQVLSLERLRGGQLTAQGWVEAPPGSPAWKIDSAPAQEHEPTVRPHRLPSYLELLRSERG